MENIEKTAKAEKISNKKGLIVKKIFFIILFLVLLPVIIIYYSIRGIVKRIKKKKWEKSGTQGKLLLMQADISKIDIMEGYEFEEYLRTLFFYEGYKATLTTWSKDYGADIILNKDNKIIVVQAKRYNKVVGLKSVQEALGSMKHYNATEAFVVTNSHFSSEAETLAKENSIRLIDREELIEMYTRVKERLKLSTKESEFVDKFDKNILDKFPYMI